MALVNAAASELDSKPCGSNGAVHVPRVYVSPTPPEVPKGSFTETLMRLLLDDLYSQIVTFLPDGLSFGIINAKVFADEVMPCVFGIISIPTSAQASIRARTPIQQVGATAPERSRQSTAESQAFLYNHWYDANLDLLKSLSITNGNDREERMCH